MQTRLPASTVILTVDDIVNKTTDLPCVPTVAISVIKLTNSSDATAADVSRLLLQDQALVVKILRLANSSYYAYRREVSDITDAVVLLGMRTVRNLALLASTYPWLSKPLPGYGMEPKQMWAHALSVGVGAQVVAERSGATDPDMALTAGILHDLGKTALSVWLENKVIAMNRLAELESTSFDAIERKVLGFDHTDVGAHMAAAWNLPRPLIQAIRSHHRPMETGEYAEVVYCVHVADYLSRAMGVGLGVDSCNYEFRDETLSGLQLKTGDLDSVADEMLGRYEQQDKLFECVAA